MQNTFTFKSGITDIPLTFQTKNFFRQVDVSVYFVTNYYTAKSEYAPLFDRTEADQSPSFIAKNTDSEG